MMLTCCFARILLACALIVPLSALAEPVGGAREAGPSSQMSQAETDAALRHAAESVKDAEAKQPVDNGEIDAALINLLAAAIAARDLEKAIDAANRALTHRERMTGANSMAVAAALGTLGSLYASAERVSEAEAALVRAAEIFDQAPGQQLTGDHQIVRDGNLHNLMLLYMQSKSFKKALALGPRSLAVRDNLYGSRHPNTIEIVEMLAFASSVEGHFEEADRYFNRALAVREQHKAEDPVALERLLANIGTRLEAYNRYTDAEAIYLKSLALASETEGPGKKVVEALRNLTRVAENAARWKNALSYVDQILAVIENLGGRDNPALVDFLHDRSAYAERVGKFAEAEADLRRALDVSEKKTPSSPLSVAQSLNDLALYLDRQARYADADPYLARALKIVEGEFGPRHSETFSMLGNVAAHNSRQGRYREAEDLYRRVITLREQSSETDIDSLANNYNNLAVMYSTLDRWDEAASAYAKVVALYEKASGPNDKRVLQYQAKVAPSIAQGGDNQRALAMLQSVLDRQRRYFPGDMQAQIQTIGLMAAVQYNAKNYKSAEPLMQERLSFIEKIYGKQHEQTENPLQGLAWTRYHLKDYQRSFELFDAASGILVSRAQGSATLEGSLGYNAAEAASTLFGRVMLAYILAGTAPERNEDLKTSSYVLAQWAFASSAAGAASQMAARAAAADPALKELIRVTQDRSHQREALGGLLASNLALPNEKRSEAAERSLYEQIEKLTAANRADVARIASTSSTYAALIKQEPLSIASTQALLRPDEALVFYLVGQGQTIVWVVSSKGSNWSRLPLGQEELTSRLQTLRCGLDQSGEWSWSGEKERWLALRPACQTLRPEGLARDEALPFDAAVAHDYYKALFSGIESEIAGKHLLIVPSGPLTALPFQVLVETPPSADRSVSQTVKWLIRDHALTILPSVAGLHALRANAKESTAANAFIGFGNPALVGSPGCGEIFIPETCPDDGETTTARSPQPRSGPTDLSIAGFFRGNLADGAAVRKLCPLPDTEHELSCVAKSLGAGPESVVVGPRMTETELKKAPLDTYRILHFATHGLLAGETSQLAASRAEPALVMTPPDIPSEEDDGLLTASEIAGLRLDADWVVMSACNTAGAGKPGAEPLSGLARAFFYAGTRALLVSHWPVDSYAATMLTSRTFAEMRKDPEIGRSEAFRLAMLALMSDPQRPWAAHPSVWAPFIVVGEGRVPASH